MTAAIVVVVWSALIVLFLIGNHRWAKRMERMDADMEAAVEQARQGRRIVSAGVRPYPE